MVVKWDLELQKYILANVYLLAFSSPKVLTSPSKQVSCHSTYVGNYLLKIEFDFTKKNAEQILVYDFQM